MKITIDDNYVLTSDAYNYVLNRRQIAQSGKSKGEEVLVPMGFYQNITQALHALLDDKVSQTTARTLNGLVRDYTAACEYIKDLFKRPELHNMERKAK
jgi:hypothetical protein